MGIADLVPGISGGTIAFITGIYEDFIEALNNINLKIFDGDLINQASVSRYTWTMAIVESKVFYLEFYESWEI